MLQYTSIWDAPSNIVKIAETQNGSLVSFWFACSCVETRVLHNRLKPSKSHL